MRRPHVRLPIVVEGTRLHETSHVNDRLTTPQGLAKRFPRLFRKVAGDDFDGHVREASGLGTLRAARQRAHAPALGGQRPGGMTPDEARAAGQKRDAAGHGPNCIDSARVAGQHSPPA